MALVDKDNSLGRPAGWYQLSVKVPADVDPRGSLYLGWSCSVECLADLVRVLPDDPLLASFDHD